MIAGISLTDAAAIAGLVTLALTQVGTLVLTWRNTRRIESKVEEVHTAITNGQDK